MSMQIKKAVRLQKKIKLAIAGPSGAGKTHTLLALATGLGQKILLIDSEHGRASLFADIFNFDVIELPDTTLQSYFEALKLGRDYDVVCVDSGSHAWEAVNEAVNDAAKKERGGNTFQLWGKVGNPLYAQFIQEIITHPAHILVSLRVKSDYVMEEYTRSDGKTGTKPVKVGLAPKFREGGEYEFDIMGNMDLDHNLIIEKAPPGIGLDGKVINKPGPELGEQIRKWLDGGSVVTKPIQIPKPLTNNDGGVRPAVSDAPVIEPYAGNPWEHIVQGENSQQGVPLCMIEDETWFPKAANQKVPKKSFTARDIAAIQKIMGQETDFNQAQRQEARDAYSEPLEAA